MTFAAASSAASNCFSASSAASDLTIRDHVLLAICWGTARIISSIFSIDVECKVVVSAISAFITSSRAIHSAWGGGAVGWFFFRSSAYSTIRSSRSRSAARLPSVSYAMSSSIASLGSTSSDSSMRTQGG